MQIAPNTQYRWHPKSPGDIEDFGAGPHAVLIVAPSPYERGQWRAELLEYPGELVFVRATELQEI